MNRIMVMGVSVEERVSCLCRGEGTVAFICVCGRRGQ